MKIKILFWSLACGMLLQCTQPIRRTSENSQALSAPTMKPEIMSEDMPDLKKSLWIFEFKNDTKQVSRALSKMKIAEYLQEDLLVAFSDAKGPFIAQEMGEEKNLFNQPKNSNDKDDTVMPDNLRNQSQVEISETDNMSPEQIAKNLRGSDVSGFMLGRITHFGTSIDGDETEGILRLKTLSLKISVEYELFDTTTGKLIAKGRENESYSESRSDFMGVAPEMTDLSTKTRKLTKSLAEKMAKRMIPFSAKLAWGGRVLKIEGGRIYINAGRKNGLVLGDTLRIIERPRDIVDPQTSQFVGQAPGRVKGTMKIIQFFGTDGSVGVLQSGGGIVSGDRVELY